MGKDILQSNVETIDTNKVKLTFSVTPEKFEEGLKFAYNKNKNSINIQGFRKGKAPRAMVERFYGKQFLYPDAVDHIFPSVYRKVLMEHGFKAINEPEVEIPDISENSVTFAVTVSVEPKVGISDYMGLTYEPYDTAVTEADIETVINRDLEKNARIITVEDRPAETGDTVILDFDGTVDGVAFEGGHAHDYELLLGSGSFIDNFEQQLTGLNTGDEKEVHVTFPEEYPNSPDLAGKAAVFKIKLNEIRSKEYPELDDDFAQDVSDFDTLLEYKADIEKRISEDKERTATIQKQDQVIGKLTERIEGEIPQLMFDNMTEQIYREYKDNIESRGIDFERYLYYIGMNEEQVRESVKIDAELRVKSRLALLAVAEAEQITVSDEDVDAEINNMVERFSINREKLEKMLTEVERWQMKEDIKSEKALNIILDAAVCAKSEVLTGVVE